ncbi:hypothetical protein FKP32DRAFT_996414 [Trametes sanguinea]|nr:hypothetical protein FKP32DRAFT_996414 [Trametes sanguinea]
MGPAPSAFPLHLLLLRTQLVYCTALHSRYVDLPFAGALQCTNVHSCISSCGVSFRPVVLALALAHQLTTRFLLCGRPVNCQLSIDHHLASQGHGRLAPSCCCCCPWATISTALSLAPVPEQKSNRTSCLTVAWASLRGPAMCISDGPRDDDCVVSPRPRRRR